MAVKKNVRIRSSFTRFSVQEWNLIVSSRCQLLSCTTEKTGKKKNRKNRLRAFPNKWNDLTQESREAIRRSLREYLQTSVCRSFSFFSLQFSKKSHKMSNDVVPVAMINWSFKSANGKPTINPWRKKMMMTMMNHRSCLRPRPMIRLRNRTRVSENRRRATDFHVVWSPHIEWTENDIDAFTEALHKFSDDWPQIAHYVRRTEQSCRAFYLKHRKQNGLAEDEQVSALSRQAFTGDDVLCCRISTKTTAVSPVQKMSLVGWRFHSNREKPNP